MYCTVKEIIRDVLDTDVPDSECVFAVVLTRGDVRHIAQDWSLTDDELETVMQRLDDAFVYGACDRVAKWHLNRSQFGIRIDHDLASISDHSLASQSITIWHASDH